MAGWLKMKKVKKGFLSLVTNTVFEGENSIGKFCRISNSYFGYATYIGSECKIIGTRVGRFCSIGSELRIIFGAHPTSGMVSTHPAFYSTLSPTCNGLVKENIFEEFKYIDSNNQYYVSIGNDVWIGDGVRIMQGVNIADGAVIATGSVVTKDVNAYEVVGGVPAKTIRKRFSESNVIELLNIKWWNHDIEWIRNNSDKFSDIKMLIDFVKSENEK